jgi:uncharacterized protein YcfJ
MKIMHRTIGVAVASVALVLTTGCVAPNGTPDNTGTGALIGGALGALAGAASGGRHAGEHALIGALAGVIAGGLVGHMIDQEQQQRLQQQSPQTWNTIQHNDYVAQQQSAPSQNLAFTPLTVEDIKALAAASVKPEAITKEIETSQSKFSSQAIVAAQQANVDPAVIECMKSHPS